jgi:lipopolysaccharide transport system ATP-binding protein
MGHFFDAPLQGGKIYPTLYISKERFDRGILPPNWRRFVIIRDLRDTLVSAYMSFRNSHPLISNELSDRREVLQSLPQDDGLLYLMDDILLRCARIQISWLEAGEPLIRYEDLLQNDVEILTRVLIDDCRLPISRERLEKVILANRFEEMTKGRPRGNEDADAHQRKGVAGDWQAHFSPRVKDAFKTRYGGVLVATGYEKDLSW